MTHAVSSPTNQAMSPATQPTLTTSRLVLRPFTLADASDVQRLLNDRDIAAMTLLIPYPYTDGVAEAWIKTHDRLFADRAGANFAITLQATGELIGAIGLGVNLENNNAELGYWLGKAYWGQGYCTEAAQTILQYGFIELGLHRIHASHFARNPASGRVMQKIGMRYEGCRRQHTLKWGEFLDVIDYGTLKTEWTHSPSQK